jgi:hypothetical protein
MSKAWTAVDDAVEEVREVRRRISARFDHDPVKLVEHYMERQKRYGDRLVDMPKSKRQDDSST